MAPDKKIVREMMIDFIRLTNKFNKLIKQPLDFGTGDLLYPTEIHTIDLIGKMQKATVTELCALFGVTKGAVSQVVGKLSDKGYVHKVRSAESGKEKILSLTARGRRAFDSHVALHESMDESLMKQAEDVTPEQIAQFRLLLGKIENHVDSYIAIGSGK